MKNTCSCFKMSHLATVLARAMVCWYAFLMRRQKTEWKDTRYDGKADLAPRPHLFAFTTPRWVFHRHHRRGGNHLRRGAMPSLSSVFGADSTAATCERLPIYRGWAALCVWNCMSAAFSARIKTVRARSSTPRLPNVVAPYARRTTRLSDILTLIGFADSEERLESC
jgi:hypothetical protein